MKAVLYNKKELPHKLSFCDIGMIKENDDEVLIKIHAVSLNAADYRSMKMGIIPKKKIFGADISGTVVSVGRNIRNLAPGDEVIGDLAGYGFGGLAEYAVAPEKLLVRKPPEISFEEGAALPMAGVTALQALRKTGNIQAGLEVLIIGSSGGVGTFAVQLAKYFGAHVTAVCSTQNIDLSRQLGADIVVDYTTDKFYGGAKTYDLILAINGNYSLTYCRRMLKPKGIYVVVGGSFSQIFKSLVFGWLFSLGNKKVRFLAAKPDINDLEILVSLVCRKVIKPVIEKYYSLENTADAMHFMTKGHARGKLVIRVLSDKLPKE